MMWLEQAVWDRIFEHAREAYPAECCGLIVENGTGQLRVHRCENIQDKLHAQDPKAHPRTSKTAYRMDDLQVHRIVREAEDAGGRLAAIYHSHIDCEAYFSEEDQNAATFLGEPAYPGVVYPVVSVVDGRVEGRKVFQWDENTRAFVEAGPAPV